jgi:hypothetical protein
LHFIAARSTTRERADARVAISDLRGATAIEVS